MSQQIRLKAMLRAYSKTPFYNDFVRDIYSQPDTQSNIQYVREYHEVLDENGNPIAGEYTGKWVALDTSLLKESLENYQNEVNNFKKQLNTINVAIDPLTNRLIFIDSNGMLSHYELPDAKVDYTTININKDYRLYSVDTPDNITLKEVDVIYENMDGEGNPLPNYYGVISKLSGKLRVEGIYANENRIITGNDILRIEKNIRDLEAYTQGMGGALDPINLGYLYRLNPDDEGYDSTQAEERNSKLNQYAYTQLNSDGSSAPIAIPDQTKIQNKYDGILWVYIEADNYWYNNGTDVVVQANNEGVLGVITGSLDKFKAFINNDGTVSINNLEEEFNKLVYSENASVEPLNNTYVKRTETGAIKAAQAIQDDELITQGQFNQWQEDISVNADEILNIVNSLYFPEFGDADGDGDIDIEWAPPTSLDDGVLYGGIL